MGDMKQNETFWNHRSRIYDEQVGPVYEQTNNRTIKHSLKFLKEGDKVLELGCGTGVMTLPISKHVQEILAVDTSKEMLERAEEKAKCRQVENVDFRHGDFMELDVMPDSLDAVLAFNVLLYLKNQEEVLDAVWKSLKLGGMFLSATDCLGRNFSEDAIRKFFKSKLGRMPFVAFDTPVGLMRKIQRRGFLILEFVSLHKNPPNIFIAAQKIEK